MCSVIYSLTLFSVFNTEDTFEQLKPGNKSTDLTDTSAQSYHGSTQRGVAPHMGQDSLLKYYLKTPVEGASQYHTLLHHQVSTMTIQH